MMQPHPFLLNYTKAVLVAAAEALEIEVASADTKGAVVYKLNCYPDTAAMTEAVHAAVGEG